MKFRTVGPRGGSRGIGVTRYVHYNTSGGIGVVHYPDPETSERISEDEEVGYTFSSHDLALMLEKWLEAGNSIVPEWEDEPVCAICSDPATTDCICGKPLCAMYSCRAICMAGRGHI